MATDIPWVQIKKLSGPLCLCKTGVLTFGVPPRCTMCRRLADAYRLGRVQALEDAATVYENVPPWDDSWDLSPGPWLRARAAAERKEGDQWSGNSETSHD